MNLLCKTIKQKLEKDNIDLTGIDIEEVIDIYNNYIDFVIETIKKSKTKSKKIVDERYMFLTYPNDDMPSSINNYYRTLKNIIKLKRENRDGFINYLLVHFTFYRIELSSRVYELCLLLEEIIDHFESRRSTSIINEFSRDVDFDFENAVYVFLKEKDEYKTVPKNFTESMRIYCILLDKDIVIEYQDDVSFNFNYFLEVTFYYFLKTNAFNTNLDKVYEFLKMIKEDPMEVIDQVQMSGADTDSEILSYIDIMFKNMDGNKKMIR